MAVACSDGKDDAGIPPSDLQGAVITLERTPCFGSCPAYRLTIRGDGSVVYTGLSDVAVEGVRIAQISQDRVRELVERFSDVDYFSLSDSYRCPVTDLPSAITSISIDGRSKTVDDYAPGYESEGEDCAAPEALVRLEEFIDEVTASTQWVEAPQ
jgi:hypothetical protein